MVAPQSSISNVQVPGTALEALVRAVKIEGALHAELKDAGFDPAQIEVSYPLDLYIQCLEIARRHCFPGLTPDLADRQLGRAITSGFLNTLVGKMVAATLRVVGTGRLIDRLARNVALARPDISVEMTRTGERSRRFKIHDLRPMPELMIGSIELGLEINRVTPVVRLLESSDLEYTLEVSW
jgi:uncharacterized protein (TIGR02265 family)